MKQAIKPLSEPFKKQKEIVRCSEITMPKEPRDISSLPLIIGIERQLAHN
jgi:hypothetical protein